MMISTTLSIPRQFSAILVALSFSWILAAEPSSDAKDSEINNPEYIIYPNDILEILVWREPDLSRKLLVRPDGRISVPLLQDLQAAGITPTLLSQKIEEGLKEYIDAPTVTVIVDSIQHYKVFVIGKVQAPGAFTAEKELTALQALTLAGGFQEYADESEITIVRTGQGTPQTFYFDYDDVVKGKKAEQNIYLQSGDVVVVP